MDRRHPGDRRLVSRTTSTATTDVVLTLTPHIIRIPDVTEEDVTPVYVGTDANISYQGAARREPDGGPDRSRTCSSRRPAAAGDRRASAAAADPAAPPINMAPSSGRATSSRIRPTLDASNPQSQVPPQPASSTSSSVSEKSEAAPADGSASTGADATASTTAVPDGAPATPAILADFDPAYLSLAHGQTQSILVRATASAGFPGANLVVHFDPKVVAAVVARPILASDGGIADATIDEKGIILLAIPPIPDMSGTRVIAQITLRGVGVGRASLSFEPIQLDGVSTTLSTAVVDVR